MPPHVPGHLVDLRPGGRLAGLLISSIVWAVGSHSAKPMLAGRGKTGVLVAFVAAALTEGAVALINFFAGAGGTLWDRRSPAPVWIEVLAALIFSNLLLVIVFVVGWGVLGGGARQDGSGARQTVNQTAAGPLIPGVAGLGASMALKLVALLRGPVPPPPRHNRLRHPRRPDSGFRFPWTRSSPLRRTTFV